MLNSSTTKEQIENILQKEFNPDYLEVIDNSSYHVGHFEAVSNPNKGHFQLKIIAKGFKNLTNIKRHQAIYKSLGDLMTNAIHALSIQASAPSE